MRHRLRFSPDKWLCMHRGSQAYQACLSFLKPSCRTWAPHKPACMCTGATSTELASWTEWSARWSPSTRSSRMPATSCSTPCPTTSSGGRPAPNEAAPGLQPLAATTLQWWSSRWIDDLVCAVPHSRLWKGFLCIDPGAGGLWCAKQLQSFFWAGTTILQRVMLALSHLARRQRVKCPTQRSTTCGTTMGALTEVLTCVHCWKTGKSAPTHHSTTISECAF